MRASFKSGFGKWNEEKLGSINPRKELFQVNISHNIVVISFSGDNLCTEEFLRLDRDIWDKISDPVAKCFNSIKELNCSKAESSTWEEGKNYIERDLGENLCLLFCSINETPEEAVKTTTSPKIVPEELWPSLALGRKMKWEVSKY